MTRKEKTFVTSDAGAYIARRPFHLSARAVKGPNLRASLDSPLKMGTKLAHTNSWDTARNQNAPLPLVT